MSVVVVLAAIALAWEAGQRVLAPVALADGRSWIAVGDTLRVPGVAISSHVTLFVVISSRCRYCSQQAAFYRALTSSAEGQGARTVALLPAAGGSARAYVASLGLSPDLVATADLARLRIPALPSLLLTGPGGRLRAEWIGALDFAQQEEVFQHLGLVSETYHTGGSGPAPGLSPSAVSRLLGLGAEVVDVRPHEEFLRGHIRGSINIPGSELPVRAPHELAGGHVVLVYCAYCADCSSVRAAEGISTNCSFATKLLGEAGYKDVRVIGGNLQDLRGAGVRVVGSTQELR